MEWLQRFTYTNGYITVAVGHPSKAKYYSIDDLPTDLPEDTDIWFSPAIRKTEGDKKADILGTKWLWVDVDDKQYPQLILPPTVIVNSGHGWHLYYKLNTPTQDIELIEKCNRILAGDIPTSDPGAWNVNRVLRVPGSLNTKDPPGRVQIHREPGHSYNTSDVIAVGRLDRKTKHKLRTGDRRGYRSRSERDWAVISQLLESGASDGLIHFLFKNLPIGDKVNDPSTPESYLDKSIAEARRRTNIIVRRDVEERADGYYDISKRGTRRLSTFVIHPRLLLDAIGSGGEDAILGDVSAYGHVWDGVTFTRSAFTSIRALDKECPVAGWQWIGRDDDVRRLLPHLINQLKEQGMPRVIATPTLGLHEQDGVWYFVTDKETISAEEVWNGYSGPLAALPTRKERPRILNHRDLNKTRRRSIRNLVDDLTPAEASACIRGWYFASPLKPFLEASGYRFPVLNVTGTRGSGKTTLIQRVYMPLLGQEEPRSYDSGTTRFVTLALLGGTNAIPIAFSEFRYSSVQNFLRFILLSYDTGHDPRGRSDQSTVDYPLMAPFSVDGEDMIADPAAQERMVIAQLHPNDIAEGTACHKAYRKFSQQDLSGFGTGYIQFVLGLLQSNEVPLEQASKESFEAVPQSLPDRIRNNHIVAHLGNILYSLYTEAPSPSFADLLSSITRVYDLEAGRGRTLVDSFVEAIINASTEWTATFKWTTEDLGKTYRFQMSSAHSWWLQSRHRQGRVGLERDAILSQLKEAEYYVEPSLIDGTYMYGVSLPTAQKVGLDVIDKIGGRK